ncbi:hypothetical protein P0Y43_11740 [Pseudomonas entomophila]|uniref:hypothetical protein n=1 Tax=Pseudomonas entomophila TaxID=312306 RepID=UPI0023D89ECF|nr:hypothetical protein [Pseudomonas entomophila]MDF0731394.1 hypothetical protein [Pseudomonas entomophila]
MRFSTQTLTLMAVAVTINIVAALIAKWFRLPIYLDCIGTLLVAVLQGPLAGALTGVASNLLLGVMVNPMSAVFIPVSLVIGLSAGCLAALGGFSRWWAALFSGLLISSALMLVAMPINIYLFGGVTGSGTDLFLAWLLHGGKSLYASVGLTIFSANVVDKTLTALLVWLLVKRLPLRIEVQYPFLRHSQRRAP